MSFSQEIKDFTNGFKGGWKMATPSSSEIAEKRKRDEEDAVKAAGDASEANAANAKSALDRNTVSPTSAGNDSGSALPTFAQGDLLSRASKAVSGVESGGRYDAVGPTHPKYGRALGKYQVMESNVPQWTQEALGTPLTGDQFLADKDAQEAVFKHRFGGYLSQTGSLDDAASMWHSGQPLAKAQNRRDSLGTATPDYVRKVRAGVGRMSAIPVDDDETPTQFAAGGGAIRALPIEEEAVIQPANWTEPTVRPEQAALVAPEDARIASPDGTTRARELVPLPPRRPSDAELTPVVSRPAQASAIPVDSGAPLPGEGMTAESDEPYNPKMVAHTPGIGDAIEAGLKEIGKAFGFSGDDAALPQARADREVNLQRFARNEGAATHSEIASIDKTIDPKGQLSEDERAVARLYGGYKYFLNKGEPERAAKYARSILQYSRLHMQTAGGFAEQRLASGDVAGAARIMQEAHNQVPDGQTVKFDKVTPQGLTFKMYDEDGDLTQQGEASVNDLMRVATGMRNGSEWLSQIEGAKRSSLTAAQKLRQKDRARDEAALNDFEAGGKENNEFIASMTPAEREAYGKMTPRLRATVQKQWMSRQAAGRADEAQAARVKSADDKTKLAERSRQDEQEFSAHIDKVKDAQEALDAQMQDDPGDTAKLAPLKKALSDAQNDARNWTAADGGRSKYGTMLSRELRAMSRGGRGASGGTGSGAASGRGGTKEERTAAGLDQQYRDAELTVKRNGNKPEEVSQLRALKSQIEFQKRAEDIDDEQLSGIDEKLLPILKKKDIADVDPATRFDYHDAVGGILRGKNNISTDQAVALAQLAVKTGKIERLDDGRIKIGDSRPVYISPEGFNALARMYQRENPDKVRKDAGATTTQNPFNEGDASADAGFVAPATQRRNQEAAERVKDKASRNERRDAKNFEWLKWQLKNVGDWREGMTYPQAREAWRAYEAEQARKAPFSAGAGQGYM